MGAAGSREVTGSLTKTELERVKRRFARQSGKSGRLSLSEFTRIPELSGNFFVERIFQHADRDGDGYVSVKDFSDAVESLGKLYTEEEKLRFAFDLCDLDEDGYVSERDLLNVLHKTARTAINRQQLERTVNSLIQEYDADRDGQLSFQEFRSLAAGSGHESRPFLG